MDSMQVKQPVLKTVAICGSTALGIFALRSLLRKLLWSTDDRLPPGSLGLPLVGETLDFVLDPVTFVARRKAEHGPVFKTHVLFSPAVYLDGENVKLLFKNSHIGWPSNWNELLGPHSMAAISGHRHKFQRSVCAAAFQPAALKSYVPTLQDLTMKHLNLWADSAVGFRDPEAEIQLYTFEVAEKILLGVSSADATGSETGLLDILKVFKAWLAGYEALLPFNLPFTTHSKAMRARAQLIEKYQAIIDYKRAKSSTEDGDMLAHVMAATEKGEPMTDPELQDFCLTMMFAGHDTTKGTIQSLLHYIDLYPDIAKELEAEVATVWDGKSPITYEMCEKLLAGKCGRFNDEVFRLTSPVPGVYRVVQEDMELNGFLIPKGWKIMSSPTVQHQRVSKNTDIDLSIDHSKLREDQFSPFGGGSRKCIGYNFAKLELLVWLMCILTHFKATVSSGETKKMNIPFVFYKVKASFDHK